MAPHHPPFAETPPLVRRITAKKKGRMAVVRSRFPGPVSDLIIVVQPALDGRVDGARSRAEGPDALACFTCPLYSLLCNAVLECRVVDEPASRPLTIKVAGILELRLRDEMRRDGFADGVLHSFDRVASVIRPAIQAHLHLGFDPPFGVLSLPGGQNKPPINSRRCLGYFLTNEVIQQAFTDFTRLLEHHLDTKTDFLCARLLGQSSP